MFTNTLVVGVYFGGLTDNNLRVMTNQVLFFFSALGAFNGFILSLYFAVSANKKKFSHYFLALLLLSLSIRIMKSVFFHFNPELSNVFIQVGLSACMLIGPFLYLYLKAHSGNEKSGWLLHTLPYLIGITLVGFFYSYTDHRGAWSKWLVKGIYLQWFVYMALSLKFMRPILLKIKKGERLYKIDVWLLSIYVGVVVIWLAYNVAVYTSYIIGALSFTFVLYLLVLLLVFKRDAHADFFEEKEKYKNKALDPVVLEQIKSKISIVADKELFLNPNLTLDETAKELKVSKHLLSQYLNEILNKSFSHFINEYRIERAKALLQGHGNYTIEGLGYDSGFNSKSTFFTTFKKFTGQTPAEYQKTCTK